MQESVFFSEARRGGRAISSSIVPFRSKMGHSWEASVLHIHRDQLTWNIYVRLTGLLQTIVKPASIHFPDLGSIPHITNMVIWYNWPRIPVGGQTKASLSVDLCSFGSLNRSSSLFVCGHSRPLILASRNRSTVVDRASFECSAI